MKPGVAFFSGAVLGVAGAYLYKNYETGKELKGGARTKKERDVTTISNIKKTFKDIDAKKAIDSPTAANISDVCTTYPKKYSCQDGVLFNQNKTVLIRYPYRKHNTTYTIPDSVTSIGDYAFFDCKFIEKIKIPDSVTSIGEYAFYHCTSLETVDISLKSKLTTIGISAFEICSSFKSITIPNSVKSIGYNAFSLVNTESKNNATFTLPTKLIESIDSNKFAEIFGACEGSKTKFNDENGKSYKIVNDQFVLQTK